MLSKTHKYMVSVPASEEIDKILETLDRHKALWL
jgi:hypothetical protein